MKLPRPALVAITVAACIAAGAAGFQVQRMMVSSSASESGVHSAPASSPVATAPAPSDATSVVGQRRPDFTLPDPDGRVLSPDDFDGKVLVVNFWATWCPPCLHEMPAFMRLQERYAEEGVQFLGIAMDEVENVRRFVAEMNLSYPTVHGQAEVMTVARAYGNELGVLPYTAVVARDGRIEHVHRGELKEEEAGALIETALRR